MLLTRRPELPAAVEQEAAVATARLRNGLRHLSGLAAELAVSPKQAIWKRDKVVLYQYTPSGNTSRVPILLVMSLISKPHVFDLRPGNSLVEDLLAAGFDVYLLDWGVPDAVDSRNGLETYCDDYLPLAVAEVAARHPGVGSVTLLGYCLGGLLALLSVAANVNLPVKNLVGLAVPVDFGEICPIASLLGDRRVDPEHLLDETGNVPAAMVRDSFKLLQPTAPLSTYANLWRALVDERALLAHQALIGWSRDHIPFPGNTFIQVVELFIRGSALLQGRLPLGGREVHLSSVRCRVLSVTGSRDHLVPLQATAPLAELLPNAPLEQLELTAGHAGLFVGRQARAQCVPAIIDWLTANS